MRILIYEINYQADRIAVSGITAVGTVRGIQMGKEAPVIDTTYHVEFSIDSPTELSVEQSTFSDPMVSEKNGDIVTFHGICEEVDEDIYFVRFDVDWLEMIDISKLTSTKIKGDCISFSADCHDITIYPYTL